MGFRVVARAAPAPGHGCLGDVVDPAALASLGPSLPRPSAAHLSANADGRHVAQIHVSRWHDLPGYGRDAGSLPEKRGEPVAARPTGSLPPSLGSQGALHGAGVVVGTRVSGPAGLRRKGTSGATGAQKTHPACLLLDKHLRAQRRTSADCWDQDYVSRDSLSLLCCGWGPSRQHLEAGSPTVVPGLG